VASASTWVWMSMVLVIGSPRMAGFFAHNGRGGARHGGHASPFVMPGLDPRHPAAGLASADHTFA